MAETWSVAADCQRHDHIITAKTPADGWCPACQASSLPTGESHCIDAQPAHCAMRWSGRRAEAACIDVRVTALTWVQ